MSWKVIVFENGSNPYICKTDKEFERINKKYELKKSGIKDYYIAMSKGVVNE